MNRQSSESPEKDSSLPRIPKKKRFSAEDAAAAAEAATAEEPTSAPTGNEGDDGSKGEDAPNKGTEVEDAPMMPNEEVKPPDSPAKPMALASQLSSQKFDPPILRKGDLVRLSKEQKSGRIQGGLARVTRSAYPADDPERAGEPASYDIEYVLGGKLSHLERSELSYTTATAEGLVDATDNSRGHLLRRRRTSAQSANSNSAETSDAPGDSPQQKKKKDSSSSKSKKKKGKESKTKASEKVAADDDAPPKRKGPGRPPGSKNLAGTKKSRKGKDRKGELAAGASKKRRICQFGDDESAAADEKPAFSKSGRRLLGRSSSRASEASAEPSEGTDSVFESRSQASKLGWETRRKEAAAARAPKLASKAAKAAGKSGAKAASKTASKSASKRLRRATSANDGSVCSETGSNAHAGESVDADGAAAKSRRTGLYTKHRRELEKSLSRLEKVDRYCFFLDTPPPQFDEHYEDDDEEDNDDEEKQSERADVVRKAPVQFPPQPPFNFLVIRKRLAAGRYDIDMVALELERRREIRAMLKASRKAKEEEKSKDKKKSRGERKSREEQKMAEQHKDMDYDAEYEMLSRSMCNPVAVDWDAFSDDVAAMCDAAMLRDPDGESLGNGHLGHSASRIKKLMEEMYGIYGAKRRAEVEESEYKTKFERTLIESGNIEAAMQGKWRREAFPERKYERLETSSVICDGLSDKDRSYAMYELETKLPDSFVGLAYTYDDSGQHSETWMKTVADETGSSASAQPAKDKKSSKSKRKKKDAASGGDSASSSLTSGTGKQETKAQKAARGLARDDGVVRAQVQTTMTTLLIQVQDKVMTDLGVMHSPEARSANWDDGDRRRDYRGGSRAEVEQGTHSGFSLPEVAEQEVWGVDCYTRKNVTTLIEREFTPEIAVEFVEKWLLPAINACPVELAHKMATAARLLEGLPADPAAAGRARRRTSCEDGSSPPEGDATKKLSEDDAAKSSQEAADPPPEEDATMNSTPDDPPQADTTTSSGGGGEKPQDYSVFLRKAIEFKVRERAPPWLNAAARLVRLASSSLDDDWFRIHPKGHGSVVIGTDGLKANSLVTYYRGEVYPAWRWCEKLDAIERTQRKLDLRPNLPDFYNMAMERPKKDPRGYCLLFVDASRKSGLGSSFSHSCNPTCEVRVVSLNGKLSLSMTTLRDLEQGEELTFDYNAVTESLNEFRFAVCLCGQRKCRGSFLHFATADCYQQVLSRNSPISARFANLVRGCMKKVMSREDSELLLKHGFNTAAFGAVSFNHHVKDADEDSTPDSIENVPIWLRTFVADCLRYIEYERRALPVALLCNQMERMEKEQQGKPSNKKNAPVLVSKKEKSLERQISELSSSDKNKAISGSRPKTSYFFYLQSRRDHFGEIAKRQHDGPPDELRGLDLSRAINTLASAAWAELEEEEKQEWKKRSIKDWKKKGGKEKARLEEERQRSLKRESSNSSKEKAPKEKAKETSKASDKQKTGKGAKDEGKKKNESKLLANNELPYEAKTITFADADAEGCSAMEQRIQQLAQSLSRVGRVLDRHRESVFAERKTKEIVRDDGLKKEKAVDSDLLRKLVPSPLKIMSDDEVVSWIWSDAKGVVRPLFEMVERHFPRRNLLLRELLSGAERCYPVLTAYSLGYHAPSSLEKKFKHSCTSADARRLVREALLKFRTCVIDFLCFAEKSHAEARNERRREQARAREKKKVEETRRPEEVVTVDKVATVLAREISMPADAAAEGCNVEPRQDTTEGPMRQDSFQPNGSEISLEGSSNMGDEAMPLRGGGGESTDPPNGLHLLGQSSTLKPVIAPERSNLASIDDNGTILPPPTAPPMAPPITDTTCAQQSNMGGVENRPTIVQSSGSMDGIINRPTIVQSAVSDDVASLLQLSKAPDTVLSGTADVDRSAVPDEGERKVEKVAQAQSPSSLLQLSKAANRPGTALPGTADANRSALPDEGERKAEKVAQSPSRLQELINAVASNEEGAAKRVKSIAPVSMGTPPASARINSDAALRRPSALPEAPPSAPPTPSTPCSIASSVASSETKKAKKKVVPLSERQVKYLKNWLFDPKHILNPYPTDEEKTVIMNDIGIERRRLDGWFMKNRQRVLHPEVPPVKMSWKNLDRDHWAEFRKNRYMLEATADLLLMYASTNTFFVPVPFRQFDSTPIEVYARELGNEVPRRFALNSAKGGNGSDGAPGGLDSDGDVPMERPACDDDDDVMTDEARVSTRRAKAKKDGGDDELCSLDDVIDNVTIDYSGEYVLSQLLQWVNGGIGQQKGLPDIYGCVMLPPVRGCWEEVRCSEVKLPDYTKWNRRTSTEYAANVRPRLAEWFLDRYQRGGPWEGDLARYFCPTNQTGPDPTRPMGSPVLDYLVTSIDENIRRVSAALSGRANTTEQGRSQLSASDRLQSTVDEGMPAQAVANWVQCENPKCLKWRKLPWHVDVDLLPENFFCKDNIWNPKSQTCEASEDEWDMEDAPIKFDTSVDDFEVGAWFDVQREGKIGYHEANIIEIDFKSEVKRVKFHFWKTSSDRDEWIEVGSPRIAPHHSYTPKPLDGYNNKKKSSDKNKVSNNQSLSNLTSSKSAEGATDDSKKPTLPFPQKTIDYLNTWVSQHAANPFPTTDEKEAIMAATGMSKRQVGDWMARARKKLRKGPCKPDKSSAQPAVEPSSDSVKSIQNSPTKVENLLLALRNPLPQQSVSPGGPLSQKSVSPGGTVPMQAKTQTILPAATVEQTGAKEVPITETGDEKPKTSIKELETYMTSWLSRPENSSCNMMPTLIQKERIIQETGIEKKRLEGWFFRARKRLKKHHGSTDGSKISQPAALNGSLIAAVNAVSSTSSGKAPAVQHQQITKKPSASHSLSPSGINISPMKAIQPSKSMSAPQPATSRAAKETTSSMKAGEASQNMPNFPTKAVHANVPIYPAKAGNPSLNVSTSLAQAVKPGPPTSLKAVKPNQSESTSSSTPPAKGLSEEAKSYLTRWLSEHASNPYPSREEKESMMSALGIEKLKGMRMLDGWFCRARKKLKDNKSSNGPHPPDSNESVKENVGFKSSGDGALRLPAHGANVPTKPKKPSQSSGSSCMASSNFASLLSAAKSELGTTSLRSSPQLHDSSQYESTKPYQQVEVSRFSGEDESMIQGGQYSQQTEVPSRNNSTHHGFTHHSGRKLGAREQAILSSFQSLQAVQIHDRSSHGTSPAERPSHQQPQGQQRAAPPADFSSRQHSQGHQQAPPAGYPPHQQSQDQQGAPLASYSSHQHSQVPQQAPPHQHSQAIQQAPSAEYPPQQQLQGTDYSSYQHPQAHKPPPPAEYPPRQQLQGQQEAHTADYSSHQRLQGHQQAPPVKYSSHQQLQGQRVVAYQQSHGHQKAPPAKYPSYQHPQAQHQPPPAEYQSYQHPQSHPQHVAPPSEHAPYPQSQSQRQAPYQHPQGHHQAAAPDYSAYQHSQGQHQAPPADNPSRSQGYVYPRPDGIPNTYEGVPNGSHPQGNGFHQGGHISYGQPKPTYQH